MAEGDDAFDYLGRRTPLSPRRVELNTAAGGPSTGGGAAVTAGVTPSVGQRASAVREILNSGPSEAQQILGDIQAGAGIVDKASKIRSLFPADIQNVPGVDPTKASTNFQFIDGKAVPTDPLAFTPVPGGELPSFTPVPVGAEAAAAGGEQGALGGANAALTEAGGSAADVLPFLGGAFSLAQDVMSNKSDVEKGIDAALDVASTFFGPIGAAALPIAKSDVGINLRDFESGNVAKLLAYDLNPVAIPVKLVDDILQIFGVDIFGGGGGLSHKQREALETKRLLGGAASEEGPLTSAKSIPDLWKAVVDMQSGSVGGKDDPATVMNLPLKSNQLQAAIDAGAVSLPTRYGKDASRYLQEHPGETLNIFPGNENATYPVWTQQGFFNALRQNPRGLKAVIQGGVAPENLAQGDQALSNTLLRAYQRLQVPPPEGAMPAMPPPQPVNVGGPSEALGFTQDVVQNAP